MSKSLTAGITTLCVALLTVSGCGTPSDQPDLGTVKGRITFDGVPVPYYIVNFQPPTGRPSVGSTDAEGNYELDYTLNEKGAKVGTHKVFIVYDANSDPGQMTPVQGDSTEVEEPALPPEARKLMMQFGGVETTTLTAEIKGGENVVNFDLKSDGTQGASK